VIENSTLYAEIARGLWGNPMSVETLRYVRAMARELALLVERDGPSVVSYALWIAVMGADEQLQPPPACLPRASAKR
jgi:hypothetical protein